MNGYEVPEPILNSPSDEPSEHWHIVESDTPERRLGRRPAMYFYRDYPAKWNDIVSIFAKEAMLKGSFDK
jgi:type III restriction enzyme